MIDWNDYHYFALVAENGSYSKAAARAGVSKSVISRHIAALEERLGISLILRTTRRVSLTPAGEQFAAECQEMVLQSERARAIVHAAQRHPQGTLRISAPVFMAETWLSEFISEFLARWPGTNVQLMAVSRPVDLIAERLDIALVVHMDELKDSSFHARMLASQHDILVASPEWCVKNPEITKPEDLTYIDTLVRQTEWHNHSWPILHLGREINLQVKPRLISNNLRVLLNAALSGTGVALLPREVCVSYLKQGALQQLLPDVNSRLRTISALFPVRRGMSALARTFLDELSEMLAARVNG